ncbi:MAG: FliM/FliN family flagellar motor switch protein [Gaiellales bacterium]
MSEVLSNDQVAALVAAAQGGSGEAPKKTGKRAKAKRVRDVDFSRPTKFTQEQQRRIARAHEGFCRATALRLTSELRTETELELLNLTQLTLSGAYGELPSQTLFGIVQCKPIGTSILLGVERGAVTSMIERLLGGQPGAHAIERELTDIELALARRALASLVDELSTAWDDLFGLTLELAMVETQLQNLQLGPPSEPTIAITIEISSDSLSATMSLVVPYRAIEGVVERLTVTPVDAEGMTEADEGAAQALRAAVQGVEVEFRAEVAATEISLEALLALEPGSVVPLDQLASHGITVLADQTPVLRANPGRRGSWRAIEVVDQLGGGV